MQKKLKGHKIKAPHEEGPSAGKVIDLMAALRKSIGKAPAKGKVKAGTPAGRRQASGGRKR